MLRVRCCWQNRPLLLGILLSVTIAACKDSGDADKAEPAAPAYDAASPAIVQPARPLDPSLVPTEALAQLQGIDLDAEPPCSLTIDTLRPALESIASGQQKLAAATDEATAVALLTALSAELRSRLPAVAPRNETDELRRISAELSASLGDLAESLRLAAEALTARDKQAAAANLRRIDNGVANTRSSVEGLIRQCAP